MKRNRIIVAILILFVISNTGVFALSSGEFPNAFDDSAMAAQFKIVNSDKTFTLLDDANGYFILSNNDYGTRFFDNADTQKFDINSEGNIAYWLNHEFISEKYCGKKLPPDVQYHLQEHLWMTEAGYGTGTCPDSYDTKCKVGLLSVTEFANYIGKIGIRDELNAEGSTSDEYKYWWTRTPNENNGLTVLAMDIKEKRSVRTSVKADALVRPAFYLNEDFFKTVKLDTAYMGSEIKKLLISLCDDNQLVKIGYTSEEIQMIKNCADSITKITVKPNWTNNTAEVYDKHYIIDDRISFTLVFNNLTSFDYEYHYKWRVNGSESPDSVITVPSNTKKHLTIKLPVTVDGNYKCIVMTSSDGLNYTEHEFEVAYINSIKTAGNARGYATHLYKNPIDESIELLKASGINIVRDGGYWNNIEPRKGSYNWTSIDNSMKALRENNIDILYVLAYNNSNYSTFDDSGNRIPFGSEEEIQGFINYALAVAEKYPWVTKFEFWNEPNLKNTWGGSLDVDVYKTVARRLSQALKSVNPEIELIVGVTAANEDADIYWTDFISSLLDNDITPYIDAVSVHIYCNFHRRADTYDAFRKIKELMERKGGFMKLYLTETGGFDGSETWQKTQAEKNEEMIRIFSEADALGIDLVTLYDFVKDGPDQNNSEHNYGVITACETGFAPTETYYSVKNYMNIANNGIYIGNIQLSENIKSHLYLYNNAPVMIAWSNAEYNDSSKCIYSFNEEITSYDIFMNKMDTSNEVAVGHSPVYIFGLDKSMIYHVAAETAKRELYSIAETNHINIDEVIGKMDSVSEASDVYNIIEDIYALKNGVVFNSDIAEKNCLARLHTAADYMSKSLASFENARKLEYDDLVKSYENYKKTLDTVSIEKSDCVQEIYYAGYDILKQIQNHIQAKSYVTQTDNNIFILNESGQLTVSGKAPEGSLVNVALLNPENEVAYIGTVTADSGGNYRLNFHVNGSYGEYTLRVKTEEMVEPYRTKFQFAENTDYQAGDLKILYGQILEAQNLLNLSRNILFQYVNSDDTPLIDIDWKHVGDTSATAVCTVRNNSEISEGKIIFLGYTDGVNTSVNVQTLNLAASDTTEYTYELKYEERPQKISAFVWDSMSGMRPLSPKYVY